jgi:hypothetical protein
VFVADVDELVGALIGLSSGFEDESTEANGVSFCSNEDNFAAGGVTPCAMVDILSMNKIVEKVEEKATKSTDFLIRVRLSNTRIVRDSKYRGRAIVQVELEIEAVEVGVMLSLG